MASHANNQSKAGSFSCNPFNKWYICWNIFIPNLFCLQNSYLFFSLFGDHLWVKFSFAMCAPSVKAFSLPCRYASTITLVGVNEVSEIHQGVHCSSFYGQAYINLFTVVDTFLSSLPHLFINTETKFSKMKCKNYLRKFPARAVNRWIQLVFFFTFLLHMCIRSMLHNKSDLLYGKTMSITLKKHMVVNDMSRATESVGNCEFRVLFKVHPSIGYWIWKLKPRWNMRYKKAPIIMHCSSKVTWEKKGEPKNPKEKDEKSVARASSGRALKNQLKFIYT